MLVTGHTFMRRHTHVSTLHTRLSSEGGSVPLRLRRLVKRGFLYRVLRCLLFLRIVPMWASGFPGNAHLVNVQGRLSVQDTGFTPSTCLILHRRGPSW